MAIVLNCWEEVNGDGSVSESIIVNKPSSASTNGDDPKNVVAGDLLIIFAGNDHNTNDLYFDDDQFKPSGFTLIKTGGNSTCDCQVAAFYKIADGTEGSTFTVPQLYIADMWAVCVLISGADPISPINAVSASVTYAATADSGSPLTVPGISVSVTGCLAIAVGAFDGGDSSGFYFTSSGWSKIEESLCAPPDSGGADGAFGARQLAAESSTGDCTMYPGSSDGMVGFQFAIAPASGKTVYGSAAAKVYGVTPSKIYGV
jgi:hypothetical protein